MDDFKGHHYTREQKISFTLLLVFGILVIGLAVLQMRNTIYGPFVMHLDFQDPNTAALFENDQVKLQSLDTDQDGLNDYEELQFYTTSPYLPDSDSDGISDKQEITAGTDPLCPEGQKCKTSTDIASTTRGGIVPLLGESINPLNNSEIENMKAPDALTDVKSLASNPKAMREMILRTGTITPEELNKIDDATIVKIAKQLVSQKFENNNVTSTLSTSSSATSTVTKSNSTRTP